jgi:hypothetical protein
VSKVRSMPVSAVWAALAMSVALAMVLAGSQVVPEKVPSPVAPGGGNARLRPMASVVPGMGLSTVCWSPYDKEYVAFGGYNSTSAGSGTSSSTIYRNWTYTYQSGVWTNVTLTSGYPMPSAGPSDGCFYYPPSHSLIFLIQPMALGILPTSQYYTYSFLGGVWSNISATTGPTPPVDGECFGGLPTPAALAWDPIDGYAFYYASCLWVRDMTIGYPVDWTFSGGAWNNVTFLVSEYNPTEIAALTWDNQTGHIVLVSGWNTTGGTGDTKATDDYWMYLGGNWTKGVLPGSGWVA